MRSTALVKITKGIETAFQRLLFDSLFRDQLRGAKKNAVTPFLTEVLLSVEESKTPGAERSNVLACLGVLVLEKIEQLPKTIGTRSRNTVDDKNKSDETSYLDFSTSNARSTLHEMKSLPYEELMNDEVKLRKLCEARKTLFLLEAIRLLKVNKNRDEDVAFRYLKWLCGGHKTHELICITWNECNKRDRTKENDPEELGLFGNPIRDIETLKNRQKRRRLALRQNKRMRFKKKPPLPSYSAEFLDSDSAVWLQIKKRKLGLAKMIARKSSNH